MIDSHCHIDSDAFDEDRLEALDRARDAGFEAVINIGIDVPSSEASLELARTRPTGLPIFAAVGLHPQSVLEDLDRDLDRVEILARENPGLAVAIGEIGLDYHWDEVPHGEQPERMDRQLDLAVRVDLPVIFHCRDAIDDLLARLESRAASDSRSVPRGVFHCFEGGPAEAERALALGFCISFAGNVTYKNAKQLHEAAPVVPLDRLLLETDSPYLAPVPKRSKRNEPAFAAHTRDFLAELRGIDAAEIADGTRRTTIELFRLDLA